MPDNVIPDNMNNKKKVQFTPLSFKYGQTSNKTSTLFFSPTYSCNYMNWSTLLIIRFDIFVLYYESFIIIFHTIFYPIYLFIYSNFSLSLSFVYCVWKQNRIPYFETTQLRVCLVPLFGILKENIFIFKVLNID